MAQDSSTHTVMPKKLAQALMEAGMHHFSIGGALDTATGAQDQYVAGNPIIHTQDFGGQEQAGIAQSVNNTNQQQSLANTLLAQSQGQGPNVAQNQLAQATGANVATQGALMAGQRGASSNPALLARMAAQQGAATQQQAAGQSATLQAQQQLAAQQALAQQQATMQSENLQQQGITQGGQAAQNTALTQSQLGAQQINANAASQNAQQAGSTAGGLISGLGNVAKIASFGILNKGGEVKKMADGGIAQYSAPAVMTIPTYQWKTPDMIPKAGNTPSSGGASGDAGDWETGGGLAGDGGAAGPADLAPAGIGDGSAVAMAAASKGGRIPFSQALLNGGNVPGKPQVKGNSEKNDTEPTLLSPGEIVLPRSVTQGGNVEKKAIEFLRHLKAKGKGGYGDVLEAKAITKKCAGGRI